ncbi:MAG: hypothetical protein JW969_01220 [Spirochaetales bacterium]|nr:hypothetical protein [Spirochaetales bacterium]
MKKIIPLFGILAIFMCCEPAGPVNNAPLVSIDNGNLLVKSGVTFTITSQVSDSDGDVLSQSWYINDVIQPGETATTFNATFSPVSDTVYVIKSTVSDGILLTEDSITVLVFDDSAAGLSVIDLGSVSGDTGSDVISCNNTGEKVLKVTMTEDNNTVSVDPLSINIEVTPPADCDYDVIVSDHSDFSPELDRSENRGTSADSVYLTWSDAIGSSPPIPNGIDDTRILYIWVKCYSAVENTEWSLTVNGNV